MSYEDEIMKRVENASKDFFRHPNGGVKEYFLRVDGRNSRADFCYEFHDSGKLFIEPEDDGAQRALGNLVKYWQWCQENAIFRPIYLISICGPENMNVKHCRLLKEKIEKDLEYCSFKYHIITHRGADNWHKPDADWLQDLERICQDLARPIT